MAAPLVTTPREEHSARRAAVLLTIPAVLSCVVIVLALFVGVAAIAVSAGPGWRDLRWFGIAALCASVYAVCALQTTIPDLDLGSRTWLGYLGGASASLLVGSWFVYFTKNPSRPLLGWERVVFASVVVVALLWFVPGACRTSQTFVRTVPWLGVSYTTTRPTLLGKATYFYLLLVTGFVDRLAFVAWRRGAPGALASFLGITVQLVAGLNDALAASGRIDTPYALDVGQFAVVVAVGTTLVRRFIADARALERSSAELRAAQKELVRRERLAALGELSAVVAHEVRNPVTVIFNAVSTLRKQQVSPEASTLIEIVNEEAERLKRVVGELLDFARPRFPSVDAVAPLGLVESAVEAARGAHPGSAPVAVTTEGEVPDLVGDEQLLRQALINLLTNALQAAGSDGHVRVRVRAEGSAATTVCFDVTDDGPGITPDVAERLFLPFFTTRASGTGLGLAIVKRIAEAHGGEVTWQPGDEQGVTFTLRVPLRKE